MKDLTPKEMLLLGAYALLVLIGLRWLWVGFGGASGSATQAPDGLAPSVAGGTAGIRAVVRLPQTSTDASWLERTRVLARSECLPLGPGDELEPFDDPPAGWLEARLRGDRLEGWLRPSGPDPLHLALVVDGRLVEVRLAAPGDTVEFRLDAPTTRAASLVVRFVDRASSLPLDGKATLLADAEIVCSGELDASGCFSWRGDGAGTCTLVLDVPGRASYRRRLELGPGEHLDLGTIPLPRSCALIGRLLWRGEPAGVYPLLAEPVDRQDQAGSDAGAGPGGSSPGLRFTYSAQDGSFVLTDLDPGEWTVRVPAGDEALPRPTPDDLASESLRVSLSRDRLEALDVHLQPARRVRLHSPGPPITREYLIVDERGHALRKGVIDPRRPPQVDLVAGSYELLWRGTDEEWSRSTFVVPQDRPPEGELLVPVADR